MNVNVNDLPTKSGVYLLKNKQGQILYIGKSIDIKNRVKTHLTHNAWAAKTIKADYVLTASEPEALIKESLLIKKYQPRYNIMLRDDKQYFYVCFTRSKLPLLVITHRPNFLHTIQSDDKQKKGARTSGPFAIGPFTEGKSLKTVLHYVRKIFPYYTQKHRKLPCSYCHIGLCPGPEADIKEYRKNIARIKAILNGKRPRVLTAIRKEMERYAKNLEFEKAAKTRNQMKALENIFAHNPKNPITNGQSSPKLQTKNWSLGFGHWDFQSLEAYDISNIQGKEPVASMVRFDNGKPNKTMYRRFKIGLPEKPDDYAMMSEVIRRRLAHPDWPYPKLFLIDGGRGQLAVSLRETAHSEKASKIQVIALAKRHNELYIPGLKKPVSLDSLPQEIKNLLMHARDEAHRFAISYHRKLHRKKSVL